MTQKRGDDWLRSNASVLMQVPSAVLPVRESPHVNVLINHANTQSGRITLRSVEDFVFDARSL